MGWFIVYLLVMGINAYVLGSEGILMNNPKYWMYWISIGCMALSFFAGRYGG